MKPAREGYTPTYPDFVVDFRRGEFSSALKTRKAFNVGDFMAPMEGLTKGTKAYTSVQCGPGPDDHVELNSDLVYGKSITPLSGYIWQVRALKRLEKGTIMTFFYPSTEWDMDQPFDCECNSPSDPRREILVENRTRKPEMAESMDLATGRREGEQSQG
ncbi:hypothetical protein D9615_007452 [Tricholomella constricta]|uniref:Uncharacterized protein n=1 Tax=Tricholomella constricta TaxID=117010 RepID=A0A8H5LXR6_9AGAR|nr:hypothetical protein D9615_007452 [Tricholomella constricta]